MRLAPHLALLGVQIAFAYGAVAGKVALAPVSAGGGGISPEALAMIRMLGAALFFQALASSARTKRPGRRDLLALAGLSLLGIVVNQTLFLVGLRLTSAFSATLLGVTIPLFTAALAVAFRTERASVRLAAGLLVATSGVVWLIGIHDVDLGAIVIALNCLSYSFYIVLAGNVLRRVGTIAARTWIFTWGALLFAPIGGFALASDVPHWTAKSWALAGFYVAIPTIFAYAANAWALARVAPTIVTVYVYLQPLFAAFLQWLHLGQTLGRRAIVASALIVAGVSIVTFRRRSVRLREGS